MSSRIIAVVLVACAAALAVEAVIFRAAHPSYQVEHFDDPALSLDRPAAWRPIKWLKTGSRRALALDAGAPDHGNVPGFDTRWDHEPMVALWIEFRAPEALEKKDPRERLAAQFESSMRDYRPSIKPPAPEIKPVSIGGRDGWSVTMPHAAEELDIVRPGRRGPVNALYSAVFGGTQSQTLILLPLRDQVCEIRYVLPGDKIARARYERIFGRILDSLKIKEP